MLAVMTGGTSGFGAVAATELTDAGVEVLHLSRRPGPGTVTADLARLDSVVAGAEALDALRGASCCWPGSSGPGPTSSTMV